MKSIGQAVHDPQLLSQTVDSESRFRALFEQITAGIAEIDLEGRFVLVNQRYY